VYGRSPLPEGERRTTRHPAAGHRLTVKLFYFTVKLFCFDGPFIREVAAATFTVRRIIAPP
jgi:hypothetical protein